MGPWEVASVFGFAFATSVVTTAIIQWIKGLFES